MKLFFEAIEKRMDEAEGEFIQTEVSSKKEAINDAAAYPKNRYTRRIHYCYHDENPSRPCTAEEI